MALQDFFDNMEDGCAPVGLAHFQWSSHGVGFGELYFYVKDNKIHCDNEMMSRAFVKKMLCKMVDDAVLDQK